MMNNRPLVSIIACCYNHERFLVETLDSIRAQTYLNIELIIIDDFSTDSSVKKINNWIKKNKYECLFIQNKENFGVVKTLNKALKRASGKYLNFIACDDVYLTKKVENQVKIFEKLNHDYGAIYSDAYIIDNYGKYNYGTQISRKQINKPPTGNIFEQLIKDNFIPAVSVLYKFSVIEELLFFDENFLYGDYDLRNQYHLPGDANLRAFGNQNFVGVEKIFSNSFEAFMHKRLGPISIEVASFIDYGVLSGSKFEPNDQLFDNTALMD